jgi:hypothetical protein
MYRAAFHLKHQQPKKSNSRTEQTKQRDSNLGCAPTTPCRQKNAAALLSLSLLLLKSHCDNYRARHLRCGQTHVAHTENKINVKQAASPCKQFVVFRSCGVILFARRILRFLIHHAPDSVCMRALINFNQTI